MMSNFLDDILYEEVIVYQHAIDENTFEPFLNELYRVTESYWKKKLHEEEVKLGKQPPNHTIKLHIDRAFNSWTCLINKLRRENNWMYELLDKCHYRIAFMNNKKIAEIYNSLNHA